MRVMCVCVCKSACACSCAHSSLRCDFSEMIAEKKLLYTRPLLLPLLSCVILYFLCVHSIYLWAFLWTYFVKFQFGGVVSVLFYFPFSTAVFLFCVRYHRIESISLHFFRFDIKLGSIPCLSQFLSLSLSLSCIWITSYMLLYIDMKVRTKAHCENTIKNNVRTFWGHNQKTNWDLFQLTMIFWWHMCRCDVTSKRRVACGHVANMPTRIQLRGRQGTFQRKKKTTNIVFGNTNFSVSSCTIIFMIELKLASAENKETTKNYENPTFHVCLGKLSFRALQM